MDTFGPVLKDIRNSMGLSQAGLAGELDSTQRHLSFLETGRSRPSPGFVSRICRVLDLSIAQRINLYEAAGFHSPYRRRNLRSDEIMQALDTIEMRVLRNWPFPALVLDFEWNVLRANSAFDQIFAPFLSATNTAANLLEVILSPAFVGLVQNWDEAASIMYYRLQRTAQHSPRVADIFAQGRARGLFDHVEQDAVGRQDIPVFVPVELKLPEGPTMQFTSMLGQLASCQDALIEGLEIELMVPLDEGSEMAMRSMLAPSP